VTVNPKRRWVAQQARNLLLILGEQGRGVRFLVRDRDAKLCRGFDDMFGSEGGEVLVTPARGRARTVDGRWMVLDGTQLGDGPDARTAVIVEPARSAELAELIVLAYGLTPRERAVTRLVIQGQSTTEIARTLHLSPFTVQDHLKAVFDKVGVRSRRELVATVFRDHYWPRVLQDTPVGQDGWYA
jgi:DNA-binding CsgD family transcriptional regulator